MRYIIKYEVEVPRINSIESTQKKIENLNKIEKLKTDPRYFIKPCDIKCFIYPNLYKDCEYSWKYNWNQLRNICDVWYRLDINHDFGKYPAVAWVRYFNGDIDTQNKIIDYALSKLETNSIEFELFGF